MAIVMAVVMASISIGVLGDANARPDRVVRDSTVAAGLDAPWGLAFLPNGSALVTERDTGLIKQIRPGSARPVRTVGRVPASTPTGEGGLLGIAVPPGPTPRWVYVYLTTETDNRIVRMSWDGRQLGRARAILTGIPRASYHDGGRLAFGPDGMLYASTGDAGQGALAQDRLSLAGKVLRMMPNGDVPADNPFRGSLVWTMGHRNVQGLAFDSTGRLYATEFGEKTVDELNLLKAGGNYGWPIHEGPTEDPEYRNPIAQWSPTSTASPSGLAIIGRRAYVATLAGQRLYAVPLRGNRPSQPIPLSIGDLGRLRTVVAAPDGSLWLMTSNTDGRGMPGARDDRILRLSVG